jgi:drug/metabolite transporter (DMT)-like permease
VTRRGWILFAAMGLIWGIPYLFIKIAVSELSPASLVFLRTAIGAALLLPVAAARRDLRPLLPHWRWIVAYTFVEVAAPWFLLSDAERRISSSLSGLLIALVPSIGAILAWATGSDDRLDLRRIFGLGLGFLGVATLVGSDVGAGDIGAVGEVALVALGYALGALIIGRKLAGLPLFGVVAASLTLTLVAYAPVGIAQLPSAMPSPQVILAVTVLGVVCTALAFLLFLPLVAEVGAARATVITYANPAVALALGVAFLGEPLTFGIVLGFVLIVVGSLLATRRTAPAKDSVALSRSPDLL